MTGDLYANSGKWSEARDAYRKSEAEWNVVTGWFCASGTCQGSPVKYALSELRLLAARGSANA